MSGRKMTIFRRVTRGSESLRWQTFYNGPDETTAGDYDGRPTGIGPETIAGAWCDEPLHTQVRMVVIGHPEIMRRAIRLVRGSAHVVEVAAVESADSSARVLPCLRASDDRVVDLPAAQVHPGGGQAAYEAVTLACRLAQSQRVDGIVTAPLNKAALAAAGHNYPGHTELLAELCGVDGRGHDAPPGPERSGTRTGRLGGRSRDLACRIARRVCTPHAVAHRRDRAVGPGSHSVPARRHLLAPAPRIGVCALNPHAGEQSLFGDEEVRIIRPAVELGMGGHGPVGPFPADTLLTRAAAGEFDAIVAMYHDQGHIALKLLGLHQAVNITLGLPVIRTSVAHGTAFDLAWKGQARCESMIAAIRVAAQLADRKQLLDWRR